jgi:opacity protein-like surface antigen
VKTRALVCVGIVVAVLTAPARAADTPEDLAQSAAEAWLKLTDAGNAGASWDQAARLFKGAVTKEQWTQALAGVRPPLGKVVSRKVLSRQYAEKLPGAPDGKYVTIQYETVFENKASAVETITPMLDPDGAWRVSGYFIR